MQTVWVNRLVTAATIGMLVTAFRNTDGSIFKPVRIFLFGGHLKIDVWGIRLLICQATAYQDNVCLASVRTFPFIIFCYTSY